MKSSVCVSAATQQEAAAAVGPRAKWAARAAACASHLSRSAASASSSDALRALRLLFSASSASSLESVAPCKARVADVCVFNEAFSLSRRNSRFDVVARLALSFRTSLSKALRPSSCLSLTSPAMTWKVADDARRSVRAFSSDARCFVSTAASKPLSNEARMRRPSSEDVKPVDGRVREDFGAPDALEAQLVEIHGRQGKRCAKPRCNACCGTSAAVRQRASRGTLNVSLGVTRQVIMPGTGACSFSGRDMVVWASGEVFLNRAPGTPWFKTTGPRSAGGGERVPLMSLR